jgi:hypothetical protein
MAMANETYLGDGLYASFDGYQFVLRAPREDGDHWVVLEPQVMDAFLVFMRRAHEADDRKREAEAHK